MSFREDMLHKASEGDKMMIEECACFKREDWGGCNEDCIYYDICKRIQDEEAKQEKSGDEP